MELEGWCMELEGWCMELARYEAGNAHQQLFLLSALHSAPGAIPEAVQNAIQESGRKGIIPTVHELHNMVADIQKHWLDLAKTKLQKEENFHPDLALGFYFILCALSPWKGDIWSSIPSG
jgi:DNA primase